jgi:hypothetical protein
MAGSQPSVAVPGGAKATERFIEQSTNLNFEVNMNIARALSPAASPSDTSG